MKKKKVIVLLLLAMLFISVGTFVICEKLNVFKTSTEQNQNVSNVEKQETIIDNNTSNEEKVEENVIIEKQEVEETPTTSKEEIKVEEKINNNSSNNSNTNNNGQNQSESNDNNTNNSNTSSSNEIKAWEDLGISEYDYYNSPMNSWATITHPNLESCVADGEKAQKESDKPVRFYCNSINSFSGRYLGEMLELEYF